MDLTTYAALNDITVEEAWAVLQDARPDAEATIVDGVSVEAIMGDIINKPRYSDGTTRRIGAARSVPLAYSF